MKIKDLIDSVGLSLVDVWIDGVLVIRVCGGRFHPGDFEAFHGKFPVELKTRKGEVVTTATVTFPKRSRKVCKRCGGSGYLHGYRYVEGGRCFSCT